MSHNFKPLIVIQLLLKMYKVSTILTRLVGIIHIVLSLFCLYFTDILFNFRTTFVNKKGEVVSDSKTIAFNYLKSWFVVDLFAALPFDLLYASDVYSGDVSISSDMCECFVIVVVVVVIISMVGE